MIFVFGKFEEKKDPLGENNSITMKCCFWVISLAHLEDCLNDRHPSRMRNNNELFAVSMYISPTPPIENFLSKYTME